MLRLVNMKHACVTREETVPVSVQPLLPTCEPVIVMVFQSHGDVKDFVSSHVVDLVKIQEGISLTTNCLIPVCKNQKIVVYWATVAAEVLG